MSSEPRTGLRVGPSGGSWAVPPAIRWGAALAVAFFLATGAVRVSAQEPPDSLPPDSVQELPDSLQEVPDSLQETPDSLRYHELPRVPGGREPGWERSVWSWSREDLLSTRALTLGELLALAPGVVPVRGGDYGTPTAVATFGLGGGGLRVFLDGFELIPLDGGVPDLARIGLGGLESVRLERGPGETRVELESYRVDDPRPESVVEAGTGDLRTNHFRGTFVHPRVFRGSLALDLERLDTRGLRGAEAGALTGGWLRYTLHRGDDAGLRFEMRTQEAETVLDVYPPQVSRRDWTLRGRARLAEGLVAEAFTGRSAVEGGEEDGLTPLDEARRQHGMRVGLERGPAWGRASWRLLSGPDLPSTALELEAGGAWPGIGGASARWSREAWSGRAAVFQSVSGWTEPFFGLSAFASWEDGARGSRVFPERVPVPDPGDEEGGEGGPADQPEPEGPTHRFAERTGYRVGALARVGPLAASAARLSFEADTLLPFGILLDREGVAVAGGEYTGWEAWAHLRLPVEGFALRGWMQRWDREARYLPELAYGGGLEYHGLPMESGNLEIWGSLGVDGRDPMPVALPEGSGTPPVLQRVPFAQSWHGFLQIRIITVRIFLRFENFTVRQNNQDLPGRIQPPTRATYGVRWTLWN